MLAFDCIFFGEIKQIHVWRCWNKEMADKLVIVESFFFFLNFFFILSLIVFTVTEHVQVLELLCTTNRYCLLLQSCRKLLNWTCDSQDTSLLL